MFQHYAILPGYSGHYQDLGISSLTLHDSACNLTLVAIILELGGGTLHIKP